LTSDLSIEEITKEEIGSLQALFTDFLRNYRDDKGKFKYRERVREMILRESKSLIIDYEDLISYDPHLADIIEESPDEAFPAFSESIRVLVRDEDPEYADKVFKFYARLNGWVKSTPIRHIRSEHINKLVMIEGIIVRSTPPRHKLYKATYLHILPTGEKHEFVWPPGEGEELGDELEKPTYCPICHDEESSEEGTKRRQRGVFKLLPEKSKYRDWQLVVVQERPEEIPAGQIPRSIEVVLVDDLVDVARPGDRVSVIGVVRLSRSKKPSKPIFSCYIEANNVIVAQRFLEELKLSPEDEEKILSLSRDPLIRRKIIASIAPTIYGMWDIKEAVALQLFGGVSKEAPDGTKIRGEIHVLLLGDPGTAKSLCYSEPLLFLDEFGKISFKPIGQVIDKYMERFRSHVKTRGETEVLNLDEVNLNLYTVSISPVTLKPEVKRIKALIRHKAPPEVLVIKTRTGRMSIITEDHSLVAFDGVKLRPVKPREAAEKSYLVPILKRFPSEFRRSDSIVYKVKIGKREVSLDKELGYFIGYFLGDGSISKVSAGERLEIVASELKVIKELARIMESKIRANVKIYKKKSGNGGVLWRLISEDEDLVNWIKQNLYRDVIHEGRKGILTRLKILPDFILNAPIDAIAGVISGLLDSDGTVQAPKDKYGKIWRGEVSITTTSKQLAQGISLLLTILGLTHTIRHRRTLYAGHEIKYYTIFISDKKIRNIACLRSKKAVTLASYRDTAVDIIDRVPVPAGVPLLLTTLGMNSRGNPYRGLAAEIRGKAYRGYMGRRYGRRVIEKLERIAAERSDIGDDVHSIIEEVRDIVDNDLVLWDTIKSISKVKITDVEPENHEYVYDISVEDNENFVGSLGLMFLHNSQILQYVARIAPRGIYTTGKGSSAAGLTAAVIRDKQTGEYFLEAGAMVLGDGGIVAIDEIDKMREEDRVAIHEAMEQGTVSIAKAGIVARLNARASVLAAGNPKRGRYEPELGLAGNINLPITILSRFDLIFILKDVAAIEHDESLVRYVLRTHERHGSVNPEIPPDLLRKYIAYARKNVKPVLTKEAQEIIKEYYIELRKKSAENPKAPLAITTRQLEALVRLAEAHARMALKNKVEAEDAAEAVRLMNTVLQKVGMDVETGALDIDTIMVGKPRSLQEKEIALLNLIRELAKESDLGCVRRKYLKAKALESGIVDEKTFDRLLASLRRTGDIYEKRALCYAPRQQYTSLISRTNPLYWVGIMCELVVRLSSGKEIPIDETTLSIVYKYIRSVYTLEMLARDLGLDNWEEAYEFIKRLPAWIAWTPSSFFEYTKRRICGES